VYSRAPYLSLIGEGGGKYKSLPNLIISSNIAVLKAVLPRGADSVQRSKAKLGKEQYTVMTLPHAKSALISELNGYRGLQILEFGQICVFR